MTFAETNRGQPIHKSGGLNTADVHKIKEFFAIRQRTLFSHIRGRYEPFLANWGKKNSRSA
jgi:hypothetical protein